MRIFRNLAIIVAPLTFLVLSANGYADEGTEDPNFDYLPPQETSMFEGMWESLIETFTGPSHAGSYQTAKHRLYTRINDELTLYCGCKADLTKRTFDKEGCGYTPRNDNDRAKRIEAEHVLPAFWIANFRIGESCWKSDDACGSSRECCLENDEAFKTAHNDLVNLLPAIGEVNGDRSNLVHALVDDEPRVYGECDFEINRDNKIAEPADDIRGDIARIYFYMRDTYELEFPPELQTQLESWNETDPVSVKEKLRNAAVHETQGTSNPLVSVLE